jgi:ribosomal protein S18 acetylase RimI-like enzyme
MQQSNDPVRLAVSQKAQAAQMLARAFLADQAYSTIFPEEAERKQALQRLFGAVVSYSLVYGLVHSTPSVEGVACWLSPGNAEITLWRMLRTGLGLQRAVIGFSPVARQRVLAVLDYMDELHKRQVPEPHWYLWLVGVEPDAQGRGIGSRLIQPVLTRADKEGLPCYLETQTESNVAFYQKRGFEVMTDGFVPDQEIRVWTMRREGEGAGRPGLAS